MQSLKKNKGNNRKKLQTEEEVKGTSRESVMTMKKNNKIIRKWQN